jgi:CRP/FNR family cyclic AMP-dependent transcriptional regulator
MKNKPLFSVPRPSAMELLGDGPSFQNTLCAMLTKVKGFEDFELPELLYLAKHMKAYRVQSGQTIFLEGDRNSHFSALIEGRICVYKEDSDDQVKLLTIIPPGRIFGEISVIDNLPYSASLVAESDAIIALMSRESFHQCINENPIIGVRLLTLVAHLLSTRLRSASGQLIDYIHF